MRRALHKDPPAGYSKTFGKIQNSIKGAPARSGNKKLAAGK